MSDLGAEDYDSGDSVDGPDDWEDADEESVTQEAVTQAVVTDTDWTAETILSQLRRGNIQLNPSFQRRDAWTPSRKSRFIESLVLALPIPQLVLAEDKRRRGAFIVLDGKQRLLALRQFAEGSSFGGQVDGDEFRKLRLSGLLVRPDLNRYDLKKLEVDPEKIDDLNAVLNQTIRTVVVRRWPNEEFLNMVFLRLNTGSVQLSPHELRQALHPGPFMSFIDDASADSDEIRKALRIRRPDFRMRDAELLLRYFAFQTSLSGYRGNLKQFLDLTAEDLNDHWDDRQADVEKMYVEFNASVSTVFKVFDGNAFFRWDPRYKRYDRRFNRAIFDIMMYHLVRSDVRERVENSATEVEDVFRRLCGDAEFVKSIQSTTKSIGATFHRMSVWSDALSGVLGIELATPPKPVSD